jgi:GNAT superfamily N-acetyltransferase
MAGTFTISPVYSDSDVQIACDILIEAADWLTSRGQPLWNRDNLIPANIKPLPEAGTLYLACLAGHPVGTYLLQFEDQRFWPDAAIGEALYLHKLAVRRSVAGAGLARRLLEHAVEQTRAEARPFLRLDCTIRPKLCAFYESAGFVYHSDRDLGTFTVRRYQRSTIHPK